MMTTVHVVESSCLGSVGYAYDTQTLEVTFRSGARYRYFGVPLQVYDRLLDASSKGRYFNDSIRADFRCECLP